MTGEKRLSVRESFFCPVFLTFLVYNCQCLNPAGCNLVQLWTIYQVCEAVFHPYSSALWCNISFLFVFKWLSNFFLEELKSCSHNTRHMSITTVLTLLGRLLSHFYACHASQKQFKNAVKTTKTTSLIWAKTVWASSFLTQNYKGKVALWNESRYVSSPPTSELWVLFFIIILVVVAQFNFRYEAGTQAGTINFLLATVAPRTTALIAVWRKSHIFVPLPLLGERLVHC